MKVCFCCEIGNYFNIFFPLTAWLSLVTSVCFEGSFANQCAGTFVFKIFTILDWIHINSKYSRTHWCKNKCASPSEWPFSYQALSPWKQGCCWTASGPSPCTTCFTLYLCIELPCSFYCCHDIACHCFIINCLFLETQTVPLKGYPGVHRVQPSGWGASVPWDPEIPGSRPALASNWLWSW